MTIAYSINSGTEIHGVQSTWQRIPKRGNVDGSLEFLDWADNVWSVDKMPAATYQELQTAQGGELTSLQTNDIDANNSGATYTTAILHTLTNGGHVGVNFEGVGVIYRVKVG